ncbi:MAG: recombination regulator RecX [Meiothermus sp.]
MNAELLQYAVRVLAVRAYSEAALERKLLRRGSAAEVEAVLAEVKRMGYLDDRKYTESYARLYQGRWGAAKIRRSLKAKGVPERVIDEVLRALEPEGDPVAEALALLKRYQSRHKGDKPKAIRFLANRGFSFAAALEAWARYEAGEAEG